MLDIQLGKNMIIDGDLVSDVVFDEEKNVSFKLRYVDKDELNEMTDKRTKTAFNPKTHQKEDKTDYKKLKEDICKAGVLGWKGVTLSWLKGLNPRFDVSGYKKEQLKEEIAFSQENLLFVIDQSYSGIDAWIIDNIKEPKNFEEIETLEEDVKN